MLATSLSVTVGLFDTPRRIPPRNHGRANVDQTGDRVSRGSVRPSVARASSVRDRFSGKMPVPSPGRADARGARRFVPTEPRMDVAWSLFAVPVRGGERRILQDSLLTGSQLIARMPASATGTREERAHLDAEASGQRV